MKLNISGNINSYYVQTLCMIFFPGEKFSDKAEEDPEVATPELTLSLEEREDGVTVRAELSLDEKYANCEKIYPIRDDITYDRLKKIAVGDSVLSVCSEVIGYRPSWGMLVGVRPSKVATELFASGLSELVKEKESQGTPLLGICLGMQLLFEKSFEYGEYRGLSLLKGEVRPIAEVAPRDLKIPHIGWNALTFPENRARHPLFANLTDKPYVYFVHSYHAVKCEDSLIASTEYGANLTAAVAKDNVMGCQFHPEKSGEVGLEILRSFCNI